MFSVIISAHFYPVSLTCFQLLSYPWVFGHFLVARPSQTTQGAKPYPNPKPIPHPPTISGHMAYPSVMAVPMQQWIAQLTPQFAYGTQYTSAPVVPAQPCRAATPTPNTSMLRQGMRKASPAGQSSQRLQSRATAIQGTSLLQGSDQVLSSTSKTRLGPPGQPMSRVMSMPPIPHQGTALGYSYQLGSLPNRLVRALLLSAHIPRFGNVVHDATHCFGSNIGLANSILPCSSVVRLFYQPQFIKAVRNGRWRRQEFTQSSFTM